MTANQPTYRPAVPLRRRSSFRELPARALAYFGRTFGSGSNKHGALKKGRAFRPDEDQRTDLQSPRVAMMTGTLSSCSSPGSASYVGDGMDVELNGFGGVDMHMQGAHGLDVLSPRPMLPADAVAGGSEFGQKAQAHEEDGLQSPKVDVYSRATMSDRHQTTGMRPRAWSRDRSGRGGGMGSCGGMGNAAQRRGRGRGSMGPMGPMLVGA